MALLYPGMGQWLQEEMEGGRLPTHLQTCTLPVDVVALMGECRWYLMNAAAVLDINGEDNELNYAFDQQGRSAQLITVQVINVLVKLIALMLSYSESAAWSELPELQRVLTNLQAGRQSQPPGGTPTTDADDADWEGEVVSLNGHTLLAVQCKKAAA